MSGMDLASLRDPSRCPDCAAILPPSPTACPACALPLQGPLVQRLWQLSLQAADVLDQRRGVLEALRGRADAPAGAVHAGWGGAPAPAPGSPTDWEQPPAGPGLRAPFPDPARPPAQRDPWVLDQDRTGHRREPVTPRQIQHLLLGLGVLLVAVAALIFAVVAWDRVGIGGRTAILTVLTTAAGGGSRLALRRELRATAEALAVLTVALLLLDAYGIREYDLAGAGSIRTSSYWAAVLGLLAALGVAARRVHPLQTPLWTAAIAAQLPLLILSNRLGASWGSAALLAQGTVALAAIRRVPPAIPLAVGGALAWLGAGASATVLAYDAAGEGQPHASAAMGAALLALGAVLATLLAADLRHLDPLFVPASAVATAAALAAIHAPMERAWAHDTATAAGVGLLSLAAIAVAALPVAAAARWRPGPLAAIGIGAALAVLDVAVPTGRALTGPWHWASDPWSRSWHGDARELLGRPWPHQGTVALGLALLTADAVLLAWRLRRTGPGTLVGVVAGALATATAIVLPVATKAPYLLAVLGLVVTGGLLLSVAARRLPTDVENPAEAPDLITRLGLAAAGAVALSLGVVWSLAARTATVWALLAVVATAAALRVLSSPRLRPVATAAGIAAVVAEVGVLTRVADHPAPVAGGIAVIAAAGLAVAARLLPDRVERSAAEAAAAGSALVAFTAIGDDGAWASIGLLAAGVAAALIALLDPDRRELGWAAGLLLSASSWVRLAAANVETPEAYTVPPALALLGVGWFTRRAERSSWQTYGPGLGVGLVPSLFACAGNDGLARPLLLGGVALVVLLAGVGARLQAPLGLGGAVLALDTLIQLGPYAAEVPRWLSIGLTGALLLGLGASFERRLRDLRRWAARFADLG